MKAVVLELRDDRAAILDREGIVSLIPDKGYTVGEILDVTSALQPSAEGPRSGGRSVVSIRRRMRRHTAVIAACLALSVFAGGISAIAMPVSTVTVDSEPSVGYGLNIFGNVVRVTAYNEKAQELVGELSRHVQGQSINKAVQITLDVFSDNGCLTQDGLSVAVSVDASPSRQETVEQEAARGLDQWKENRLTQEEAQAFSAETVLVTSELREEARQEGVTPGRIVMENYRQAPPAGAGNPESSPEAGSAPPEGSEKPAEEPPATNEGSRPPMEEGRPEAPAMSSSQEDPAAGAEPGQNALAPEQNRETIPGGQNSMPGDQNSIPGDQNSMPGDQNSMPETVPELSSLQDGAGSPPQAEAMPSQESYGVPVWQGADADPAQPGGNPPGGGQPPM